MKIEEKSEEIMLTYAVFAFVLLGGAFLIDASNYRNRKKYELIYAGIVIVLFWGSLDALDYGTDIMNYYNNARVAVNLEYSQYLAICAFEDGYATWIWVIAHLFKNPQVLLFAQYAFITYAVFRFIYRNSKDVFLSLVVYICLGCFGFFLLAFRQTFAIAICLFAYEQIKVRHHVRAVLLIIFASMFHQTAIVFLPIVLLYGKKIKLQNIVMFSAIMIIVALSLDSFVDYGNELFEMEYGQGYEFSSYLGGLINIVIYGIAMVLLIVKYRGMDKKNAQLELEKISILIYVGVVAIILYFCRFYVLAMERVAYYFIPAFVVLLPEGLTKRMGHGRVKNLSLIFVFLSIILFLVRSRSSFGTYNSIWW